MKLPPLPQRIAAGLSDAAADAARREVFEGLRPRLAAARPRYPRLQETVRRIKMDALEHLEELTDLAADALRRNGCAVAVCGTAAEAREYILRVIGAGAVVKSKSNAAKEIGVVEALDRGGGRVVETDLGDRINQLNGTYGGHIIAPAVQIPKARVRELFSELAHQVLPDDPAEIVKVARADLRSAFAGAGYGLSGCNALAADTGAVCVVERGMVVKSASCGSARCRGRGRSDRRCAPGRAS